MRIETIQERQEKIRLLVNRATEIMRNNGYKKGVPSTSIPNRAAMVGQRGPCALCVNLRINSPDEVLCMKGINMDDKYESTPIFENIICDYRKDIGE